MVVYLQYPRMSGFTYVFFQASGADGPSCSWWPPVFESQKTPGAVRASSASVAARCLRLRRSAHQEQVPLVQCGESQSRPSWAAFMVAGSRHALNLIRLTSHAPAQRPARGRLSRFQAARRFARCLRAHHWRMLCALCGRPSPANP